MGEKPLGHMDAERFKATLSPEAYASLIEATSQSAREAGHFVVLGMQDKELPPQDKIAAFAKGIELDPYSARQRLLAPTPRIMRRDESQAEADKWVSWARALGLKAFRLSERAFFQFNPVSVVTYSLEKDGVIFELENGKKEKIRPHEVLCLVHGAVRSKQTMESNSNDLMGSSAFQGKETLRVSREMRLDVHLANVALIFRLAQNKIAFERQFPGQATGSDLHMQKIFGEIRKAFPAAVVRDDFTRASDVLGQSWRIASQSTEFRYASMRPGTFGATSTSKRVVSESDVETFDLYSLMSRMQLILG